MFYRTQNQLTEKATVNLINEIIADGYQLYGTSKCSVLDWIETVRDLVDTEIGYKSDPGNDDWDGYDYTVVVDENIGCYHIFRKYTRDINKARRVLTGAQKKQLLDTADEWVATDLCVQKLKEKFDARYSIDAKWKVIYQNMFHRARRNKRLTSEKVSAIASQARLIDAMYPEIEIAYHTSKSVCPPKSSLDAIQENATFMLTKAGKI